MSIRVRAFFILSLLIQLHPLAALAGTPLYQTDHFSKESTRFSDAFDWSPAAVTIPASTPSQPEAPTLVPAVPYLINFEDPGLSMPSDIRKTEAEADCLLCHESKPSPTVQSAVKSSRETLKAVSPIMSRVDGDDGPTSQANVDAMMRAINRGVGRAVNKRLCYRAVKEILVASKIITRQEQVKYLNGVGARDAMHDLLGVGFKNTYPKNCEAPGTIRVYRGTASGMGRKEAANYISKRFGRRLALGDIYGHVEIVGSDHKYHYVTDSSVPINDRKIFGPERRVLSGCFVKH